MKTLAANRIQAGTASLLLLALSLFSVGCATSSQGGARSAGIPEAGKGRITFYRPSGMFGYAQRAEILVDGAKVGKSVPGAKFEVDLRPGTRHVSVPNMMYPGENTLEVTVRERETTYVKTSIGGAAFGGRTNVELVGAAQGAEETADLKLLSR